MCGIVGLCGPGIENTALETLAGAMNNVQRHRGPDDGGVFFDPRHRLALAMRRLSILDLSGGHQPMSNHDESVWIVYNGEVYNAPELRKGLEGKYNFKTANSDTEVLIHLYEEEGIDFVRRLNGMFAFVLYDRKRSLLVGGRDPMGIKPLYYQHNGGTFAFASELKSLLQLPGFSREINFESLQHYLSFRYVPGEETIYQDVKRIPPGHAFTYNLETKEFKTQSYWNLEFQPENNVSEDEWVERIRAGLREAVLRWTLSDVPIGYSLSGGLDSTLIMALLSQSGFGSIKTYSIGFEGPGEEHFSETDLARQVAQQYGTDHHELMLNPDTLLDDLIDMVWHLDEPYGGGLPSWYVFRFMREEVTVGFTGSGGDELFGNYAKWRIMESGGMMRSRLAYYRARKHLGKTTESLMDKLHFASEIARVHLPSAHNNPLQYYHPMYYNEGEKRRWYARYSAEADTVNYLNRVAPAADTRNIRDRIMAIDFKTQLPEEFLFMTDRFSMAHSLEARVPFLDKEFVELVSKIPASVRTKPDDYKYLLRKAAAPYLPNDVITGRKRGFVIPTGLWLRGKLSGLVNDLLNPDYLKKQGIFSPRYYDEMVKPHLEGRAERGERIWTLFMFQLWYKVFIENNCTQKPSFRWSDL